MGEEDRLCSPATSVVRRFCSISHFDICYETKKQTNIRMNKSLLSVTSVVRISFGFPISHFDICYETPLKYKDQNEQNKSAG